MDDKRRDINAQSSTRFWGRRRTTRMASATGSLVLAIAATIFMLQGGPSGVTWLNGARPSWLPFGGTISWLPFGHASAATPTPHPTPKPTATPVPVVVAHTPTPAPVVVHTPVPTARPTARPTVAPTAEPTAKPTPKPTPTPTPTLTPTPTPSGPAPGTILLADNFEAAPLGPAPANWSVSPAADVWSVAADGTHVLTVSGINFPTAITGSSTWTNYKVSADVKVNPTDGHARLIARYSGDGYFYACGLDHPGTLFLGKEWGGTWYEFKSTPYTFVATEWYRIDFSVVDNTQTCTVTDSTTGVTATVTDTQTHFANGGAGVVGENGAEFDNFRVTAL